MRRPALIARAVVAAAALCAVCAGCASSDRIGSVGSAAGSASASPSGIWGASPIAASPSPMVPSDPAATAAFGNPPAAAAHALATIGGVGVACPDGAMAWGPDEVPSGPPLSASTKITAFVRCETVSRNYAGLGEWNVQLAEVADNDGLDAFVAALRLPSQKPASGDVACPAIGWVEPWFALIDSSGRVLHPKIPTTECGMPNAKVLVAMNGLHPRVVDAVRVSRINVSSLPSGCGEVPVTIPAAPSATVEPELACPVRG